MLPKEVIRKIRRIQIKTSHMVNDVLAGAYESVFKGRGMEFDEVREYSPGDEIRTIDWNVTARTGHPYVKKFIEERELTVMLLVDASSSGLFGTVDKMKREIAAELSAVLAFSAIQNNDKVGLIIFTDKIEKFVPPKKGKRHVLRVIRELLYFSPKNKKTDISIALEYLNKITSRRTVCFLVSDFLDTGYEKALKIANKKHDIIAVTIKDPREISMPDIGIIELEDAETGEKILIDTGDRNTNSGFYKLSLAETENLEKIFQSMNVDNIKIRTDKPYIDPLIKFFRMRERRL